MSRMLSFRLSKSIKPRMVLTFTFLIIIYSVTISSTIYYISKNMILEQISHNIELTMKSISNYMDGYLSEKAQVTKSLTLIKAVDDFDVPALKNLLPQILINNPELSNVYVSTFEDEIVVFYKNGSRILEWDPPSDYSPQEQDWYKIPVKNNRISITPAYIDEVSGQTMVSLTAPYWDAQGKIKGVVGVDIRLTTLVSQINAINITDKGMTMLLDSNGRILAFNDESVVMEKISEQSSYPGIYHFINSHSDKTITSGEYLENDGNYYDIFLGDVPISGWKLIMTIPHVTMMAPVYRFTKISVGLGLLGILVFGFVTSIVASRITGPIIKISYHAKKVSQGDLDAFIQIERDDEIGVLADSINDMTINLREMINQVNANAESIRLNAELEKNIQIAEMNALQMQINPHFMFNILNTVNRLITLKDDFTAQQVLNAFTKMLRYSMREIGSIVSLEKELDYVQKYIFLQQIRFGARIQYNLDIDSEMCSFKLPFFSLQPLVENAIIHALEPMENGGKIQISAKISDKKAIIMISDDGIGIPPNKIAQIKEIITFPQIQEPTLGIGISNVHNRLRLYFGNKYNMNIESNQLTGTIISLSFNL